MFGNQEKPMDGANLGNEADVVSPELTVKTSEAMQRFLERTVPYQIDWIRDRKNKVITEQTRKLRDFFVRKGFQPSENLLDWVLEDRVRAGVIGSPYTDHIRLDTPPHSDIKDVVNLDQLRTEPITEISLRTTEDLLKITDPYMRIQLIGMIDPSILAGQGGFFWTWDQAEDTFRAASLNYDREVAINKLVNGFGRSSNGRDVLKELLSIWLPVVEAPREGKNWVFKNGKPARVSIIGTTYGDDINEPYQQPMAIPTYHLRYDYEDGTSVEGSLVGYITSPGVVRGVLCAEVPET